MESRPDPSNMLPQEQMFFNNIDPNDAGRSFFGSNSGMAMSQDDFLRQQEANMDECCDPHQYLPPTPSSPLSFPPVLTSGIQSNTRHQITAVTSSDSSCSRPYQHSPYRDNQVSSSFPMNTNGYFPRAQLPTVPTSKQFTGEYGFEISFGPPTESAPKSATWTYSTKTSKLYTNIGSYCPFQFKTNGKSMNTAYIRAVAMFKGSSNLHDIVKMCANHAENNNEDSPMRNNFFIRSNNANALYLECPQTGRHSVLVPYSGPQAGTNYVTEMFAFKCFSSCASGHGRKPIEIIFTLEDAETGSILGRCVVEIRVCACPGRDRRSDELNLERSIASSSNNKRASKQKGYNRKRVKKVPQEEYTITTASKEVHDLLVTIKLALESKFRSDVDEEDESSSTKQSVASTSHEASTANKQAGYPSCM
ncbi:cellular tumor antigen p53-like isoform X5 [Paramuricea clavata]|uniref:Cellular tumor antigen p53-like isoform X5 n=2 Tax=Paramuricea clavata TaxID=317549 RepID=A0A7D9E489_PARCT|nr:cellular tumor antigen p53-like isoform X5 [Paramuricea clavata]